MQSAWPILKILAREGTGPGGILLSTTTPTGREMAYRVAAGLFHEHLYYPWDVPWIVRRSLDAIRPRAFAVLETEIWPLMLDELRERGIPAILVNGRFSDKTAGNIRSHLHFWRRVYKSFSLLLVRSERDRELLLEIGLEERRVQVTGDCKIDAILLREEEADLGWARAVVGETGPVFLAGSTHPGEEEIVLEAFQRLKAKVPSARLIVAPRHPRRSTRVLELAKGAAPAALLSEMEREKKGREAPWDILVADRIGVLFDLYGVVEGAFVGGSLVDRGGQNIMEPAAFGIPLSHGPFMRDFREASESLGEKGVSVVVRGAGDMAAHWESCLKPEIKGAAREGARRFFSASSGAAKASVEAIRKEIGP